jgi:signal transduction histidine kinase
LRIEGLSGHRMPQPFCDPFRIQIDVADTGTGISHEDADSIFDENVTTKPDGSGVGLALSRAIVSLHGGKMWAANNEDSGATVSLTLPTAESE